MSGLNLFKLVMLILLIVGCGGNSNKSSNANNNNGNDANGGTTTDSNTINDILTSEITLDATAGGIGAVKSNPLNKYTYFNFETGSVTELSDSEAALSSEWDIAFKRSAIKLNGGISGPKGVTGYFVNNNAEAYDASNVAIVDWFNAATKETELEDFTNISEADIPAASEFTTDSLVKAVKGDGSSDGWWLYNPATHAVSANDTKYWVIKSSEGTSYAKVKVDSLTKTATFREITVNFSLQAVAATTFSDTILQHTFNIPLEGGYLYYDFDTQSEVASDDNKWDFKIGYDANAFSYDILLNGGITGTGSASSFGPFEVTTEILSGADVPFFTADSSGGIFVTSSWYAYNLANDHKLYPNYRVYIINSGVNSFKLQVLSYYHPETTESSFISIRFGKIK